MNNIIILKLLLIILLIILIIILKKCLTKKITKKKEKEPEESDLPSLPINNFNAYFHCSKETFTIDFITTKDIKKGEEIFVDYGGEEYWSSRNYVQVK